MRQYPKNRKSRLNAADSVVLRNPDGLCLCGCGSKTRIATQTRTEWGWLKGFGVPYLRGHNGFKTVDERFWSKVDKSGPVPTHRPELGPCWLWTASCINTGYGHATKTEGVRSRLAHRISYFLVKGDDPELGLDHICHNGNPNCGPDIKCHHKRCVNPDHLEPVTQIENVTRGFVSDAIAASNRRRATSWS